MLSIHCIYSEGQFESDFVQRHYEFEDFNSLSISGYFRVKVIQSDIWDIHISCSRDDLQNIKLRKNSNVFEISVKEERAFQSPSPVIIITMPELTAISLAGSVQMEAGGFSSDSELIVSLKQGAFLNLNGFESSRADISMSGPSKLHAFMSAETIEFTSSGSADVRMGGRAQNLNIRASGPCRFDGSLLLVDNVNLDLEGLSEIRITPDVQMNISSSDEALIYYSDEYMDKAPIVEGRAILRKN